jgi:hypothetical protein
VLSLREVPCSNVVENDFQYSPVADAMKISSFFISGLSLQLKWRVVELWRRGRQILCGEAAKAIHGVGESTFSKDVWDKEIVG